MNFETATIAFSRAAIGPLALGCILLCQGSGKGRADACLAAASVMILVILGSGALLGGAGLVGVAPASQVLSLSLPPIYISIDYIIVYPYLGSSWMGMLGSEIL